MAHARRGPFGLGLGGKSNGESPFFETPNLSFEGRVGILAARFSRLVTVSGPPRAAGASAASAPAGAHASGTKLGTKEQGATFSPSG